LIRICQRHIEWGFEVCWDSQNSRVWHFFEIGGGYRVIHCSALKISTRTRLYGVTYVKLKDTRQTLGTNGEQGYKMLKFSAYYETC